jgi:hypothetical protein
MKQFFAKITVEPSRSSLYIGEHSINELTYEPYFVHTRAGLQAT